MMKTKLRTRKRPSRRLMQPERGERKPELRFTPYAWAKLQYFCHRGETEIGGFGVTAADDPLLIEDFVTVKQEVSVVSVAFDDEAVASFFDDQVDAGRQPVQFARIWLHTHPGDSPHPSPPDEDTFARVFGSCDWAVMFILARGGDTYARLRFNVGPGGQALLPVTVDYEQPFEGSDHTAWESEYQAHIEIEKDSLPGATLGGLLNDDPLDLESLDDLDQWQLESLADERAIYEDLFEDDPDTPDTEEVLHEQ